MLARGYPAGIAVLLMAGARRVEWPGRNNLREDWARTGPQAPDHGFGYSPLLRGGTADERAVLPAVIPTVGTGIVIGEKMTK